jgi:twitching motility protein PilT
MASTSDSPPTPVAPAALPAEHPAPAAAAASGIPGAAAASISKVTLVPLLKMMAEVSASDLHITAGAAPHWRIDGKLVPIKMGTLTPDGVRKLCYSILEDAQRAAFERDQEIDLSFDVPGVCRFRANIFTQRGSVAGAFRRIPFSVKTFGELGLPAILADVARKPRGLILVTGPTGSGKSTTLAAVVDLINSERQGHIVLLEDPIEYLHQHKRCVVAQREMGADSTNFKSALRNVLRQDPDVVFIGEMRDHETMEAALTISETGRLALATLHTNSTVQSIARIVGAFPPSQQEQIRMQLSMTLEAIVCQQLIPRIGGGRALAMEILIPTPAVRNLIREDKAHQIYSVLQTGRSKSGMQSLNQSLSDLVGRRVISLEEAMLASSDPEELRTLISSAPPPAVVRTPK